jgi:hypothetical protein
MSVNRYVCSLSLRILISDLLLLLLLSSFLSSSLLLLLMRMPRVWHSIKSHDAKEQERTQRHFVALCQYHFSIYGHATCEDFLKLLKIHNLHERRIYVDTVFCISVYSGSKCCPSPLDIPAIPGVPRHSRSSSLFTATCYNSPPAIHVVAANCRQSCRLL